MDEAPLLTNNDSEEGLYDNSNDLKTFQDNRGNVRASTVYDSPANEGFTPRRCILIPMVSFYCFAGGIYMLCLPQYTQLRMKERDLHTGPKLDASGVSYDECSTNKSDPAYQDYITVQQDTARWTIYFSVASLLPAIVGNVVWPSFSDVLGRKFVFFVSFAGAILKTGVFAIVIQFKLSLAYLVIVMVLDGVTGSFTTMLATIFSYVCDISSIGKKRTMAIVMFELLLGLTLTLSSLLTGYMITAWGFFLPMIISTILLVVGVIFGIFLPETSPCQNQTAASCRQRLPQTRLKQYLSSISEAFKFYFAGDSKLRRTKYILLIVGFTFFTIPYLNRGTMETLYQLGMPFCWTPTKIGWFGAVRMGITSILGVAGTYVLHKCMADDSIATSMAAAGIASYIVEGLAKTDTLLYIVPLLSAPSSLPIPMIRSIMSAMTESENQGALFASIGAVETMCALIGSLTNNMIYSATLSIMGGFVFLIMAGLTAISVIFLIIFMFVNRSNRDDNADIEVIVPD